MSTSPITTHVLDTSRGCPATGLAISLSSVEADGSFHEIGAGTTDQDGRIADLLPAGELDVGRYRITFHTAAYFETIGTSSFYPVVHVDFEIMDAKQHYHVPLLLNPYGYSTYRGS